MNRRLNITAEKARKVLGLSPDFSHEELKRSYWRISKQVHPDLSGDNDEFTLVKEAFDLLSEYRNKHPLDLNDFSASTFPLFLTRMGRYIKSLEVWNHKPEEKTRKAMESALSELISYRQESLKLDDEMTEPQKKLVEFFITRYLFYEIRYKGLPYVKQFLRNLASSERYKLFSSTEKELNIITSGFFTQFINKNRIRAKTRMIWLERNRELRDSFNDIIRRSGVQHNQDVRELAEHLLTLLNAFEKVLYLYTLCDEPHSSRKAKSA